MNQTFQELASWLAAQQPRLGGTRLVLVDGPAGSGKTTFANGLSAEIPEARVLHLDDLYEGWTGLDDELWARFHAGVLHPLSRAETGRYQRYDWLTRGFAEWHDVPPADLLIAEGVGAAHRAADLWATLRVWVEAPEDVRLQRGLDRDGPELREEWLRWLRLEAEYFAADATRDRADLLVDGSQDESATSYAVLEDRRALRT